MADNLKAIINEITIQAKKENISSTPDVLVYFPLIMTSSIPPPQPWQPLIYFPSLRICLLEGPCKSGIMQYLPFCKNSF